MTFRILAGLSMATAVAAGATAAHADAASLKADVRCLIAMSTASDPGIREQVARGTFFFVGKVLSQDPKFDFAEQLPKATREMTIEDLTAERVRCGPEVKAASDRMGAAALTMRNVELKESAPAAPEQPARK